MSRFTDRTETVIGAAAAVVIIGLLMMLVALVWAGASFDSTAATTAARGHAGTWADAHGFAGPIDCGRVTGLHDHATCIVRAAMGQPVGAVLHCDADGCTEVLP